MPRTTIDLDSEVLRALKARRALEGKPLGVIASELLASALHAAHEPPAALGWESGALDARVDLDDTDAVHTLLDRQ